ncbi:hypothetical protein DLAC_09291 [Tieghemostelium lacteum]|uniref:Uncharacterized protein n=1 Tax=Tieghemostelium lacteum TaxID=361077 RepID=A0A151Z9M0_TIELA|nr:hypothetical protein DLAC_09291 [Tieghemostelium lacteum]|eukprot:KYQ90657.1 hypothetical protein DLAC_09291 [Tieghemostelium lacteum]
MNNIYDTTKPHSIILWLTENFESLNLAKGDELDSNKYYLLLWETGEKLNHFTVYFNKRVIHCAPNYNASNVSIQQYLATYPKHDLKGVYQVLKPNPSKSQTIMDTIWTKQENCLTFCLDYLGLEYAGKFLINIELMENFMKSSNQKKNSSIIILWYI